MYVCMYVCVYACSSSSSSSSSSSRSSSLFISMARTMQNDVLLGNSTVAMGQVSVARGAFGF